MQQDSTNSLLPKNIESCNTQVCSCMYFHYYCIEASILFLNPLGLHICYYRFNENGMKLSKEVEVGNKLIVGSVNYTFVSGVIHLGDLMSNGLP